MRPWVSRGRRCEACVIPRGPYACVEIGEPHELAQIDGPPCRRGGDVAVAGECAAAGSPGRWRSQQFDDRPASGAGGRLP